MVRSLSACLVFEFSGSVFTSMLVEVVVVVVEVLVIVVDMVGLEVDVVGLVIVVVSSGYRP